jgi:hypothetical protein
MATGTPPRAGASKLVLSLGQEKNSMESVAQERGGNSQLNVPVLDATVPETVVTHL